MTYGEAVTIIRHICKHKADTDKYRLQLTLMSGFYSGYFSRVKHFPSSVTKAFPEAFDRTATGGISVNNPDAGFAALSRIAANFNKKRGEKKC